MHRPRRTYRTNEFEERLKILVGSPVPRIACANMQLTLMTTKIPHLGTVELAEASTVDELIVQAAQQHGTHIKMVIALGKVVTDTSQPLKEIEGVHDGATLMVMLQKSVKSPLPSKHVKAVEQVGAPCSFCISECKGGEN